MLSGSYHVTFTAPSTGDGATARKIGRAALIAVQQQEDGGNL
ncbi:hypothetical protein N183_26410 [Sinorhizobium sp. Sb3]|nr:hypothetical protein N183_26410 [Sinorhizobium sp. Sb3]